MIHRKFTENNLYLCILTNQFLLSILRTSESVDDIKISQMEDIRLQILVWRN